MCSASFLLASCGTTVRRLEVSQAPGSRSWQQRRPTVGLRALPPLLLRLFHLVRARLPSPPSVSPRARWLTSRTKSSAALNGAEQRSGTTSPLFFTGDTHACLQPGRGPKPPQTPRPAPPDRRKGTKAPHPSPVRSDRHHTPPAPDGAANDTLPAPDGAAKLRWCLNTATPGRG